MRIICWQRTTLPVDESSWNWIVYPHRLAGENNDERDVSFQQDESARCHAAQIRSDSRALHVAIKCSGCCTMLPFDETTRNLL